MGAGAVRSRAPLLLLLWACCAAVSAQQTLWQVTGNGTTRLQRIVFLGDVDRDGIDDVAIAALMSSVVDQIWIVSGRDGSLLRIDPLPVANVQLLSLESTGDMNQDGITDYAVTTRGSPTNYVTVVSATDGRKIWEISGPNADQFGGLLVGDLDLDGDGKQDLVVFALRENVIGTIHAYDHLGRQLYQVVQGASIAGRFGGDLDGDGAHEYVVGVGTEGGFGSGLVLSGRTGEVLVAGYGENPGDGMGTGSVTGCDDVDGDGVRDFVGSSDGGLKPGVVTVFSGRDGHRIHTWRQAFGSFYGDTVASGDLDLDGVHDLLIYLTFCNGNHALELRSLRDGQVVKQICTTRAPNGNYTQFGDSVVIGRPHPGDPFPVFLVLELRYGGPINPPGRVHLIRAAPTTVQGLGPGCAGTLESAPHIGLSDYGPSGIRVHLSHAPPAANALLLLGISSTSWQGNPLPLALDPFGFPGCALATSVEVLRPVITGTHGIDHGYAMCELPLPLAMGAPQATVYGQWLVLGAGPFAPGGLSAALSWQY